MNLPPFLLDRWLEQKQTADSAIDFDLGSSTGPVWTLRELLALSRENEIDKLLDTRVLYTAVAGTAPLRNAIAALHGVEPTDVQVVTGASEALLILCFLAKEPGANVVLPNPGFPANVALVESFGIEARLYQLRAENDFRIDPSEIVRLIDGNTKFVLVNSPHNPTGAVITADEMRTLHDLCVERGTQLVSDEVYHPIYHGHEIPSAACLPDATVISDFSKALCLSGLRIGWMIDRDAARRERYQTARNYFTITGNVLGEQLATFALAHSDAIYARARCTASANLELLDTVFARYEGLLCWIRPRGGMTAFPWLTSGADTRDFCRRLLRSGVLMVPGDCFGQPHHFRLGFAASGAQFSKAVGRFTEFLDKESRHAATG
jgi:aspartate/methionine/tyrosine aminotransferase